MAATLFGDEENEELIRVENRLRSLGYHSLHPDIVHLYYGHLYRRRWNIEYVLAVSPIRGKTYIFTEGPYPEVCVDPMFKIHSPLQTVKKSDKYVEIEYPLDKLTDRASYSSKKSFYNAVKAPDRWFEKEGATIQWVDEIPDMQEYMTLYDKWVQQKIDRGVHLITFPVARYRRCIEQVNQMKNLISLEVRSKENQLIAFRLVLKDKERAYDIAFISDLDIPQLSNAFNFAGLELLYHCNVKTFNCGVSSGKLKAYKKQYPNVERVVYLTAGANAR